MKRTVFTILSLCLIFTISKHTFAGRFEKSGEYYRYFENDGSVAYDKIVEVERDRYYVNENGYAVFNSWVEKDGKYYYAGDDGKFYGEGVHDIDHYKYYLNYEGELQKGWCNDYLYYGDQEDGFLISGFHELEIPKSWITEDEKEKTGWFYFDSNTCKRYYAEQDAYATKMVGERKYCFDQNGIIRTGWRKMKDTTPAMKGYMYFVEDTTGDFKFGEAVTNTWYSVEPPSELMSNSEVRYFYFNGQGQPRCAQEGKYMKVRFNDKTYLFNEFGYAVYGIHVVNNEYYYFGPGVSDCSMKTGLLNYDVDGTNDGASFFFQDDGIGLSGVKNNKLYYKGKLQMASSEQKYAAFKVNNLIYLVNSSGSIMKNKKKVTDGDGCKWSTNSGGVVTYKEEGADYTEAAPPELSNDY